MIKAVIFDIGNVLLSFDFGRVLRRVLPHCGVNSADFSTRLEPLKMDLESGRISADAFLDRASVVLAYRGERAELVRAWQEIFEPIEQTHRLVEGLACRLPLYLLSNTNNLHAEYFMGEYAVFRHFKDRVFSHESGLMKPIRGFTGMRWKSLDWRLGRLFLWMISLKMWRRREGRGFDPISIMLDGMNFWRMTCVRQECFRRG